MIIVRIFLSWVPAAMNLSIVRFIYQITDPILEPFRVLFSRFMPKGPGVYLDFSPVIALIVLNMLRRIVISLLARMLL